MTKVDGKRVELRPNEEYDFLELQGRGRDGSLLIYRWSAVSLFHPHQTSVWYQGQETPLEHGGVTHYRDRRNYAGFFQPTADEWGPSEGPPQSFVVEDGQYRPLGDGSMVEWGIDGLFVLEVPLDKDGDPTPFGEGRRSATRLVWPQGDQTIRGYRFFGRERDGTVVLTSYQFDDTDIDADIDEPKSTVVTPSRLLRWRNGHVLGHWELPVGWTITNFAPDGWILLRHAGGLDGWRAGILRNGILTPVDVSKPKGMRLVDWKDGAYMCERDEFRFSVTYREKEHTFSAKRRD